MNDSEGCLKLWSSENWTIINSSRTPMVLVFDQRWEGKKFLLGKKSYFYNVSQNAYRFIKHTNTSYTIFINYFHQRCTYTVGQKF